MFCFAGKIQNSRNNAFLLVIWRLGIQGFGYLQIKNQLKTANYEEINTVLAYFKAKMWVLVFEEHNVYRNITPADSKGNL